MKKGFIFLALIFFSYKPEEKTASIRFSQQDYDAWKTNVIDAVNKLDSSIIALKVTGSNENIIKKLQEVRNEVITNGNFILQADSIFYPKPKQ